MVNNFERLLKKLNTPVKIQDYLDSIAFNFEKKGETYRPPLEVFKKKEAHCFEGALFAVACLNYHKNKSLLLDLKVANLKKDADHVVTLFKINGLWGAISKTNHSVLRYRDPIYISPRELATSYFHEYFLDDGTKNLASYSLPFDVVGRFGTDWIYDNNNLDYIATALDHSKHLIFYPKIQKKYLRKVGKLERKAASLEDWQKYAKLEP